LSKESTKRAVPVVPGRLSLPAYSSVARIQSPPPLVLAGPFPRGPNPGRVDSGVETIGAPLVLGNLCEKVDYVSGVEMSLCLGAHAKHAKPTRNKNVEIHLGRPKSLPESIEAHQSVGMECARHS